MAQLQKGETEDRACGTEERVNLKGDGLLNPHVYTESEKQLIFMHLS
jgi:hypothetical protein